MTYERWNCGIISSQKVGDGSLNVKITDTMATTIENRRKKTFIRDDGEFIGNTET